MPRALRSVVIDEDSVGTFHCVQRCVRRSFLCGEGWPRSINSLNRGHPTFVLTNPKQCS